MKEGGLSESWWEEKSAVSSRGFNLYSLVFRECVQGLAETFREDKRGFGLFTCQEPDAFSNQELGLHLGTGTGGYLEEVTELLWGVAGETFRDIGWDGDDGATKLVAKREPFFGWQNLTELIDLNNQVHAELPYI